MIQCEGLAAARLADNAHHFDACVSFTLQLIHKLILISHLQVNISQMPGSNIILAAD